MAAYNNSSTNFCPSFQYKGLLIFNNLFTFLFSATTLYLSVVIFQLLYKRYGLYHVNVRLLLMHFCLANGATSAFITVRIFYNFSLLIFGLDVMQMSRLRCTGFESVYAISQIVASISISAVGFERFVATVGRRHTDPEHSKVIFRIVAASIWVAGCLNACLNVWNVATSSDNSMMCYCFTAGSISYQYLIVVLAVLIFTQVTTFVSFGYVHLKNKHVSKNLSNISKYTLQERYQISNNISTTLSLFPNVISNAILYTFVCTAALFIWTPFWNGQVELVIHLLSGINDLISITCFLQCFFLLKFNKNLTKAIFEDYELFKLLKRFLPRKAKDRCIKASKSETNLKKVVSFRVSPEENKEILENMWMKYSTQKQ